MNEYNSFFMPTTTTARSLAGINKLKEAYDRLSSRQAPPPEEVEYLSTCRRHVSSPPKNPAGAKLSKCTGCAACSIPITVALARVLELPDILRVMQFATSVACKET